MTPRDRVWLFDLDDTLHNASHRAFRELNASMTAYIETHLGLTTDEAVDLRHRYWIRYGATLTGLQRHHGIKPAHFLHETHRLPGLEAHLHGHAHDLAALRRLPGRKFLMTNAPRAYAERVLAAIGLSAVFEGLICIEDMACFGHSRPSRMRACSASCWPGWACSRSAACWSKTPWFTRRPPTNSAWPPCGCSAGCAGPVPRVCTGARCT